MVPVVVAAIVASLLFSSTLTAQGADAAATLEYRMKAVYLLKFISFVTWPADVFASGEATITIGVVGDSPILRALSGVQGKTIKGRVVLVQHFEQPSDVTFSHILFIPLSRKNQVPRILSSVSGKSTLTVSETDRFIDLGGMINIFSKSAQIRFEIDENALNQAGLKVSPEILALAG